MTDVPPLQPGGAWTPALAAAFLARHDRDVLAEMARLEAEMREAFPHGTFFGYRDTAEFLMRGYPVRANLDGQLVGFVQARIASGAIHGGVVAVLWETGEVVVRG